METKIITEGLSSLSDEMAKKYDIYLIRSYIIYGDKNLKEEVDIKLDDYYAEMVESQKIRKTAHANYHDLKVAFETVRQKSDQILYLAATSKLTGTYQLAQAICKEYGSEKIKAYDTESLIGVQGIMAIEAAIMGTEGKTPAEICKFLDQEKPYMGVLGALETLKYLAASGRIGKAKALFGNLLSIKPIIGLKDGEIAPVDRARTRNQALEKIIAYLQQKSQMFGRKKVKFFIEYLIVDDWLSTVKAVLEKNFACDKIEFSRASAAIGTHLGPGTWGINYYFYA
ncbi:hypothetical protein COS81_03325 [candidate division WWE3 bacterium CG06_land_8_20_14_3_00_42_16]|uniref:DegV family protein n=4 Tax=Katanobacteria TaxID=422282 RepID=A0A2M7AML3_UNCKA|nr:MAG: hypothetical protein COS81_03325 [candidate division WWE3 bacterium CG06_land_8_20_14_3_00_42_16]PIZ43857.1 MAG: hypothetical protein COY34_00200 [candidate division WWE3 bacterium CG_4_10_14_0_2_um_filter_42_8]PJA37626.1 MAG: hypothetical protein CO181_02740 [candidate division WWE3 bacterium CG_4_9_14_3_um_filter_43_9]PJC67986.1 MAG: hypothetical protein CO015_05640 [candidate division WWE3 bacterium CG_4_8_14_3_um_filter_42_11]